MGTYTASDALAGVPVPEGGSGVTVGQGQSLSEPYAPGYLNNADTTIQQLLGSAQTSAADQKQRLLDYIGHLYQLRNLATQAARGAGARGASGQQNPLAVYRSLNEMASQAGIPMDTEISKALQQGNGIENTLNSIIAQAAGLYAQMGSIPKSQSNSYPPGSGGGSVASVGGGGHSGGYQPITQKDIFGNVGTPGSPGWDSNSGYQNIINGPNPFGDSAQPGYNPKDPYGFGSLPGFNSITDPGFDPQSQQDYANYGFSQPQFQPQQDQSQDYSWQTPNTDYSSMGFGSGNSWNS